MSNFTYSISPEGLTFGKTNDKVGFSLHITANKRSTIPTLFLEVPYGKAANQLIVGDISGINIGTPTNQWSVQREILGEDKVVFFTIESTARLAKDERVNIGFINVPVNGVRGTTTLALFEEDEKVLSQTVEKVEDNTPSVNAFRATLPFIFRKTNTTLYWNITNGKNIALYRQYVNYIPRTVSAEAIKQQSTTKLIASGLLENQTYEIRKLEQNAIFYLFADNDNPRSPYASCSVSVQQPLIIDYKIEEGQRQKHVYGHPLVLSWKVQFSNPNNPNNKCWIEYKVRNRDGSVKETRQTPNNLPTSGTYTFYPTAPTDYFLCIEEPDFNKIMQEIAVTVSPTTPIGAIAMFSGATNKIPKGWMLCDGGIVQLATLKKLVRQDQLAEESFRELKNVLGTPCRKPDLRDRFIMGGSPNNVNAKGEPDPHTHTIDPPERTVNTDTKNDHTHKFPSKWFKRNLSGGKYTGIDTGGRDIKWEVTQGGGRHHHRATLNFKPSTSQPNSYRVFPAWYAVAFMIKVLF